MLVAQVAAAQSYVFEPPQTIAGSSASLGALPPGLAFGGGRFLLVWPQPADGGPDLQGALVSAPSGAIVAGPFAVSRAPEHQDLPAVARRANDFLVIWNDSRAFPASGNAYTEIYGARVSDLGVALDPLGIPISPAGTPMPQKFVPRVACQGDSCVVVFSERFPIIDWQIRAVRLDGTTAAPADGGEDSVAATMRSQFLPDIARCDAGYCVIWSADVMSRFPADGVALDALGTPLTSSAQRHSAGATRAFRPALTSAAGRPWAAWLNAVGGVDGLECGFLGAPPSYAPGPPTGRTFDHLAAAWDGERIWLAWASLPAGLGVGAPEVSVFALDDAGQPGEGRTVANATAPKLSSDGDGGVLVAWYDWSSGATHGTVSWQLIRRVFRDGGAGDGGALDAGSRDGGSTDGGARDAGFDDAGRADGGGSDGGGADGGGSDGGGADGGGADGGGSDGGGVAADAGADGGAAPLPLRELAVGCGCASFDPPWPALLLALWLLQLIAVRGSRRPDA